MDILDRSLSSLEHPQDILHTWWHPESTFRYHENVAFHGYDGPGTYPTAGPRRAEHHQHRCLSVQLQVQIFQRIYQHSDISQYFNQQP